MRPEEKIKNLFDNSKIKVAPGLDQRILNNALAALEKSKTPNSVSNNIIFWRQIMKSKITKLAVAAVIIIAVITGIHHFGGSLDGSSVAWAGLAERIAKVQTCVYRMHSITTGMPTGVISQEGEIYISSEYGMYMKLSTGKEEMIMYMLPQKKVMLSVMPKAQKYMRMNLTDQHLQNMRQQNDPREVISQIMKFNYSELGTDVIDGIEVEGIETNDPNYGAGIFEGMLARLWIDKQTGYPALMEMEMDMKNPMDANKPMHISMVMNDFQWDIPLEAEIFEPNIPDDYTSMGDVQMPEQTEGAAVAGLKLFAELSGGKYPSSLKIMDLTGEMSKLFGEKLGRTLGEKFGKKGSKTKPDIKDIDEHTKDMMPKMMTMQGAGMFYAELLQQKKEPAYYGDIVTADNPDFVLLRWKISDDQYRVIFGDLTAENVSAQQLAQLEAALKN